MLNNLKLEIDSGRYSLMPLKLDKTPIGGSWGSADQIKKFELEDFNQAERLAVGITKEANITLIDFDRPKDGEGNRLPLTKEQLKTIEFIIKTFSGKIIGYPTVNGAHFYFRIDDHYPEDVRKKLVGATIASTATNVDYLPYGYASFAKKINATGDMEQFINWRRFEPGELCSEAVELFDKGNFNSLEMSSKNLDNLAGYPMQLLPLGRSANVKLEPLDEYAGRNNELQRYASKVHKYFETSGLELIHVRYMMKWLNETMFESQLSEREVESIKIYKNTDESLNHAKKVRESSAKLSKTKKENVEDFTERQEKLFKTYPALKDISRVPKGSLSNIITEMMNNEDLEIRLLGNETVCMRYKEEQFWKSNPDAVLSIILAFREHENNFTVNKASELYEQLVLRLNEAKANNEPNIKIDYQRTPVWIDKFNNQINPFDPFNEDGTVKIQTGLIDGVLPVKMNIDFKQLGNISQKHADILKKFISFAIEEPEERVYFLKMAGYSLMQGDKFLRKMVWLYSGDLPSTGKSTMGEILNSFHNDVHAPLTDQILDGPHGTANLANQGTVYFDDIRKGFKKTIDVLKTVASEKSMVVNPKGKKGYNAYMPKMIMSMNKLPGGNIDKALVSRIAPVKWGTKSLGDEWGPEEKKLMVSEAGKIALLSFILEAFRGVKPQDAATSAEFWKGPENIDILEYEDSYIDSNKDILKEHLLIIGRDFFIGKTYAQIEVTLGQIDALDGHKFQSSKAILRSYYFNKNNIKEGLQELGLIFKQARGADGVSQRRFVLQGGN